MLEKLFTTQLNDIQNALGQTTLRQSLLTQNLANVNVPGYKRQDVDFHVALQNQLGGGTQAEMDQRNAAAQALSDATSLRSDGNNVDMEREVTGISETDLHYQALIAITTDYFSGLKSAIREGK